MWYFGVETLSPSEKAALDRKYIELGLLLSLFVLVRLSPSFH